MHPLRTSRRAHSVRRARLDFEQLEQRCLMAGDFFTLVTLPDTQFYSESRPDILTAQAQWIVNQAATRNIAFLTHLGDVVQNSGIDLEWQRADSAIDLFDGNLATQPNGLFPYSVAIGNHDFEPIDTHVAAPHFAQYFGSARYQGRSWYGGSSSDQFNHFQIFSANGLTYLHISLEWEPRSATIQWAQNVISAHPNLPTILTTHAYLSAGERYTATKSTDGQSGEQVFQQLVTINPQIFLVVNGHFNGETHRVTYNRAGLEVIEMQVDYQSRANGGDGWLRYLEFHPAANRIDAYTYSPTLNQFETDGNSQFSIPLDFSRRFQALGAPYGQLTAPLDNGSLDFDPRPGTFQTNLLQNSFQIQLTDTSGGIADPSVTSAAVALYKDGVLLSPGSDYLFSFNASTDQIVFTPVRSFFENGTYELMLNSGSAKIRGNDGQELLETTLTIDIDTSLPSLPTAFYFAMSGSFTLPNGVAVADEDIHYFDGSQFHWYFDGSDLGLSATAVDAFSIVSNNVLLLSFRDPIALPGIAETVDDSDIVQFTATQLGSTTAGTFAMYFDGSDVELTSSTEDIDALDVLPDGSLIISTTGGFGVGALAGADEDLFRFHPTSLGDTTAGTFSLYFDGSIVGLAAESVDGAAVYGPNDIYLTLNGDFVANGPTLRDEDILVISANSRGPLAGPFTRPKLFFDGSVNRVSSGDMLDFHIPLVRPPGNHAPDARNDRIAIEPGQSASQLVDGQTTLLWNDSDIDMPADQLIISATVVRSPQHGNVTLNSNGSFVYVHDGSNTATDIFFYELRDSSGATDVAAVIVDVLLNSAPSLTGIPDVELQEGTSTTLPLNDFYFDVETPAANATFEIVSPVAGISATIHPVTHVLTIAPDANFFGEREITVRVTDTGDGDSPPRTATDSFRVTVQPVAEPRLFLTIYSGIKSSAGVSLANEDILLPEGSSFAQLFDGSDVGLSAARVTDIAIISQTEILMIFSSSVTLPGTTTTADIHDVVKFTATQLGSVTSGTFSLYFDGDDVGLDTTSEALDGLEYLANGTLLLSTKSSFTVPGVTGRDEDILLFDPIMLGSNTSGTWTLYFDGSDVGLSSYDIDAIALDANGNLLLSSDSDFSIPGLAVADEDVFRFVATSLGATTAGSFDAALVFDGSLYGLTSNEVPGVDWAAIAFPFSTAALSGNNGAEGEANALALSQSTTSPTSSPSQRTFAARQESAQRSLVSSRTLVPEAVDMLLTRMVRARSSAKMHGEPSRVIDEAMDAVKKDDLLPSELDVDERLLGPRPSIA